MKRFAMAVAAMAVMGGCGGSVATSGPGPLRLARIFGDHMVLQRDMPVRVWGWGQAGEEVTVSFAGQSKVARAGADGAWSVRLEPMAACGRGRELTVAAGDGQRRAGVRDVLVGEVWLCSGQSNMVMPLRGLPGADAVEAAADKMAIRTCYVNVSFEPRPLRDLATPDPWVECTGARIGDFSGVGMFFAARLGRELKVPVGIVIAAMGGSRIEAWTPREVLAAGEPGRTFLVNDRAFEELPERQREFFGILGERHLPCRLFNSMIAPLSPMTVRGVLSYQGEANALQPGTDALLGRRPDANDFRGQLAGMIAAWRKAFGRQDLPFVLVQLPRYNNQMLPLVREGQRACAATPNVALAATIDTGSPDDSHPKDKEAVGTRAALAALGKVYGLPLAWSGPAYRSMRVRGGAVEVQFDHAGDGLSLKGGRCDSFEVAGPDGEFLPASGSVKGSTVTLTNPSIPRIVSVRYAWRGAPKCSLYNSFGLPAGPFRADKP